MIERSWVWIPALDTRWKTLLCCIQCTVLGKTQNEWKRPVLAHIMCHLKPLACTKSVLRQTRTKITTTPALKLSLFKTVKICQFYFTEIIQNQPFSKIHPKYTWKAPSSSHWRFRVRVGYLIIWLVWPQRAALTSSASMGSSLQWKLAVKLKGRKFLIDNVHVQFGVCQARIGKSVLLQ